MHLDDENDWALLARYFAGDCTPDERAAVERWLAAEPGRREEVAALGRWWDNAAMIPSASRVDHMWERLARRMHASPGVVPNTRAGRPTAAPPNGARATPVISLASRRAPERRVWHRVAAAVAAGLVLMLGGTAVWRARQQSRPVASVEPAFREYATTRGQRATVRLADGTRVDLGFASTLRVRPFEGGRREMYLEGEAVFDVIHDEARPFIVHAANAVTEDLGTVFGVRAYPGDDAVRVVVVSGEVGIRAREDTAGRTDHGTVLRPGQVGRLDGEGKLEVVSRVNTGAELSWLTGGVAFQNTRLDAIAAELERRFDVTIRIPDSAAAAKRVTVEMPVRSLDEVLDAVTIPLHLRARRTGGEIVIGR